MATSKKGNLSVARLGAKGRITIPLEHRRDLTPAGDGSVLLFRVGDAVVIAPVDEALTAATDRLETQMHRAGSTVQDLIAAATEARREILRQEFGVAEAE